MSLRLNLLKYWIQRSTNKNHEKSIYELREEFTAAFNKHDTHPHVDTDISNHKSPDGIWYTPKKHIPHQIILYFHGGGMCFGGSDTHAHIVSEIAHQCQMRLFFLNYRLSPEFPFPKAIDDAFVAYKYLLSSGYEARHISIAADSSGGLLALGLCYLIKEKGLEMPNILALLSPATSTHICFQDDLYRDWERRDPVLNITLLRRYAVAYLAGENARSPLCSPIYSDLKGYPPIFSVIGDNDILIEPLRQLHLNASTDGVINRLFIQPDAFHGHYLWLKILPEAQEAIDTLCRFIMQQSLSSGR